MTPAEVGHRALRAFAAQAERWLRPRGAAVPPPDLTRAAPAWIGVPAGTDPAPYLEAAERLRRGRYDLLALEDVPLGSPPHWNRDPKSGVEAPLAFGRLLDYRDPELVGDIKYLWELNRHLHLVTLAQACALSRDARHAQLVREHLESWFDACPYPLGPNWSSALEAALRLINWSAAWQLLGGAFAPLFRDAAGARFRRRWLDSVFRHAQFVRGNLSLYSSANNHLIGEAAGLFIAALTWPCWREAGAWLSGSQAILERETLLQNAPDGVNREQAVCYQRFDLELLLLCVLAGAAARRDFSAAFRTRVEAMLEFLVSITDAGGNVPMVGDSDDGAALNLFPGRDRDPYRRVIAAGALAFRRAEFRAKAGVLEEGARWLFDARAEAAFRALDPGPARLPVRQAFPEGGYYILGRDFESGDEIRLIADAGPLGYTEIAAHGHADALAFTLSLGGVQFLIDPGTFAYHTHPEWRAYFRGTSAHNTVRVDGLDQSQPGGSFLWLRKARAGCTLWSSTAALDLFEGWHDGYLRLADPVLHRRRIALDKAAGRVRIEDILEMSAQHEIELFFHCDERCRVEPTADGYALGRDAKTLTLRLPRAPGAASRVYCGSVAPPCGWVSRGFDRKQPAPTIVWRARLAGPALLRTEIEWRE
jgi:hypothetical protein